MIQIALKDNTTYAADLSDRATGVTIAWNKHGTEKITANVDMPTDEAFIYFNQAGPLTTEANAGGLLIADARLENPKLTLNGLGVESLGYWAALSDVPYTALWSSTTTKDWQPVTDVISGYQDKRFSFDTNNRLYIAPQKSAAQNTASAGGLTFAVPDKALYGCVGISFDYQFIAPTSWIANLDLYSSSDFSVYTSTPWSVSGSGSLQSGTFHGVITGTNRFVFNMFYNAATATYTGETGAAYIKITNLRIVANIVNRINTTLTASRAAGTNVTATVGSTSGMYVGQQLQIESGTNGETVTVQSITNSTQFVATFARAHASTKAVQAHVITTSQIAQDIAFVTNAVNTTQLSSSVGGITATSDDLTDEVYEDKYPSDILAALASKLNWSVGVNEARTLYLRPRSGRSWFVDATDLQVQRSLSALRNDAYAVYQDAAGNTLRTANNPQSTRYSIVRRAAVTAQTTSATLAATLRDTSLLNTRDVLPQASFPFDQIFDERGAAWPLWALRPDDTITVRNLPPDLSTDVNRVTTFRLTRVEYHCDDNTVVVEPEAPLPILEALLG
jgi:hypothetical protein